MLVICNGMPRSASTWSFNVTVELLRRDAPGAEIHSGYDEDLARFLAMMPAGARHAVVKCHQLDDRARALTADGRARLIYTWRDPADAVVSCMRMFSYDFKTALGAVAPSLELHQLHLREGQALVLRYHELVGEPAATAERIARHIGLNPDPRIISAVVDDWSLERTRERADALPVDGLVPVAPGIEHDPKTLLHRDHIRNGSSGYGARELSAEQLEQISAVARSS